MLTLISCKRDQNLIDLDSSKTILKYPAQCYNAQQDTNEAGVDCGGPCLSCNVTSPACTFTSKTVNVGENSYTSVGTTCGLNGNYYTFSGNYENSSYLIELGTPNVDISKVYNIVNSSFPNPNEATVKLTDFSLGILVTIGGNLYVSKVGGVFHATICGGIAKSGFTGENYLISGDVVCQ